VSRHRRQVFQKDWLEDIPPAKSIRLTRHAIATAVPVKDETRHFAKDWILP